MSDPHFFYDFVGPVSKNPGRYIVAEYFCTTLHVNVDNEKLSDAEFRKMVRNTLPIVSYKRPEKDSQTA